MWARPQRQSITMLTSDGSQHGVMVLSALWAQRSPLHYDLDCVLNCHCVWQMGCCMLQLNSCTRTGNLAACLSISLFICACVHMRVDTEAREQPRLLSSGGPFSSFETVSYWLRAPCLGEASWPASPRNLPAAAFHSADVCHHVQHFCMVARDHSSPWC